MQLDWAHSSFYGVTRKKGYMFIEYLFLIRCLWWSNFPVVVRDVGQDAVDAEVGPTGEHSLALGAVFGLVAAPVATEAG